MQSILEELYIGDVGFATKCYAPDSPYIRAAKVKHECMEKLLSSFNESEKELFEQYCGAQSEIDDIIRYDIYESALKFGVMLMIEIFTGSGVPRE